ncbi:uncharacterized protein EI97DRAFT_433196 [Westerdykella ornata]|uniref:Uncharacterized protein n=1 Tax=Westerdykella ornata TaxID=318751 RepID=A0A6A6JJD2_WESOR|nr:uncharacterized protein EI97DRAFT_433196 [Westerdykella ornata]KAF2276355.1 hypothetical protein EI97DRAFT_433196 [Westerdykella ornata]
MAVKQRRKTRMTVTVAVIRLFDTPRNGCSARLSRKKFTAGRGGVSHPSKVLRGIGSGVGKFRYPLGKERWKQWPHGFGKPNEILNDRLELSSEGVGRYNVQSILQALESDKTISMSKQPLSEVCSNTELFLRSKDPDLGTTSEDRILRSLLLVQAAIEVLSTARIQHDKSFIIPQDGQIGIRIDETCMANYQHLLLRLQTQLLKALTRKSAAASSLTDLDKTQRKRLNWFSEFPDGQRPLSTTWPWSIKPSLAVLWGVCWMFPVLPVYDETDQQSQQNVSIRVRIPQQRVLQDGQLNGWNPPQPDECEIPKAASPPHWSQRHWAITRDHPWLT